MATVLIVEDEALVREVVQIELEDAGYDVIIADCADAAIAILEARTDINLVFTDNGRPGYMIPASMAGKATLSVANSQCFPGGAGQSANVSIRPPIRCWPSEPITAGLLGDE